VSKYSISKLGSYETCPRQFQYRYIDRERGAFDSIESFMGSRVHDVVEWLYLERLAGRHPTLAQATARYESSWISEYQTSKVPIRIVKQDGSTQSDYAAVGRKMLCSFYPRFQDDDTRTIQIERKVNFMLGGKYEFEGYIDRLAQKECGTLEIVDYKTSKHTPEEFIGKEADQLRAYALGVMIAEPDVTLLNLRLSFLRSGKDLGGMFRRIDMEPTEKQLLSRIKATEVPSYTVRPSVLCGWCGFNDRCEGPKGSKGGEKPLPF